MGIKGKKWYQEDWKYGIIVEKNEKENRIFKSFEDR